MRNNINIIILEDSADTHIYNNISKLVIADDKLIVNYEDNGETSAIHFMDLVDEIIIKIDR